MAIVKLTEYECRHDLLPDICMFCGKPAVSRKPKTFSWHPEWVWILILLSLLIAIIIAAILTKRMKVRVPVCEEHEGFWKRRSLTLVVSFFAIVTASIAGFAIASEAGGPQKEDFTGMACGGGVFLFIGWLVVAAVYSSRGVRPAEITDRFIRLRGVNDAFVDALSEDRERDREEEEEDRRKRRAKRQAEERERPKPIDRSREDDDLERRARG